MAKKLLSRAIKKDGKGVFFHIGGSRLRPVEPKKTRYKVGNTVYIYQNSDWILDREGSMIVLDDLEKGYEIWNSRRNEE